MNELALFAGAGGGLLASQILGWRTLCAVELDAYARSIVLARQKEGHLDHFPVWDDVRSFDGRPWKGHIQVLSGGFPCQDISVIGKGAGIKGKKSGLWTEMARIANEVEPEYLFMENSPMLAVRGLGTVLSELAAMGYDARWGVLGARHVGAPHRRDRIWIAARNVGYAHGAGLEGHAGDEQGPSRSKEPYRPVGPSGVPPRADPEGWWSSSSGIPRVADDVANRVDRLRAVGNGQVPTVATLAWKTLTEGWI